MLGAWAIRGRLRFRARSRLEAGRAEIQSDSRSYVRQGSSVVKMRRLYERGFLYLKQGLVQQLEVPQNVANAALILVDSVGRQ